MYVLLGKGLGRPVELTEDERGRLILLLEAGIGSNDLVRPMNELLLDVTTWHAARLRFLRSPLSYTEAAAALGVTPRWLSDRVNDDPTIPHTKIGKRVRFQGTDIEEIRLRFAAGELRHQRGGPPVPAPMTMRNA
jgi:hypothetical protein